MAVTRVQRVTAQTAANSPTSITATFASTIAGNLLLLFVAVSGSPVAITTPTNWTAIQVSAATDPMIALFAFTNNPGGITTVAVTVTATNGGATIMGYEFSGFGASNLAPLEYSTIISGTGTAIPNLFPDNMPSPNEVVVYGTAADAVVTFTNTQTPELTTDGGVSSTVATTNIALKCENGTNTSSRSPQASVSLSVSEAWKAIAARFQSNQGNITYDSVGGVAGVYVGQFFQGSIGG
jgi:hypothetical protein